MNLRRTAGALAGLAVVGAAVVALPGGAQDPSPAAVSGQLTSPAGPGQLRTVTLLTGDRVRVVDGKVAGVRMAAGRETQPVWQYEVNGHQYVLPADAAPLVEQDRLDRRLFDITELAGQGLDDTATATVPLIVEGAPAPRAAERTAVLPARGLTVVEAPKTGAAWPELAATAGARGATGKVWLNGRVRPALEDSVPQVGAPAAWAAGFTGTGAKVAVLDTGYDAGHPDLAGVVTAAQDFTGEGIADTVGHGTHVAATIAGTGAASGGRRKGVAPGARLLVGKVLGDRGGTEADVIAGMQWAVEQGADVVNMSLGGGPTDGTDLMSTTLNDLAGSTGTLFVVAAGNKGARETVGAPGAADRALTVASVTKDDQLSTFSSRGPRRGDHGLKPEIAAPGSDIVAARATGTNPEISVDEHYTRMSGTSMATPHVAGAAAVLAGQHPDWPGDRIKAALVGTAARLPGIDTYAQGAGRLDLARAVRQRVRVEGLLGFGAEWADKGETTREVTYVNDGDAPVTLRLDLQVESDLFTVDRPAVTVPAHGSATATVTARVPDDPEGEPSGALVATADGVSLTTPLTARLPGRPHALTVRVVSRDASPDTTQLVVQDERTGRAQSTVLRGDKATFTVQAGSYRVLGRAMDPAARTDTFFVHPTGEIDEDTEVVVDTRTGREVTTSVDDPDARAQPAGGTAVLSLAGGTGASIARTGHVSRHAKLYAVGSPRMTGVSLLHFGYWTHPFATVTVDGPDGFELEDTYVSSYPRPAGTVTGQAVFVGNADRAAIDAAGDVRGKIAVIASPDPENGTYPPGPQLRDGIALLAQRGARLVLSNFNPQHDQAEYTDLALPVVMVFNQTDLQEIRSRLAGGPVTTTVVGRPNSPVAYFVADHVTDRVPEGVAFRFQRATMGAVDRELVDTLPDKRYRHTVATWSFGGMTGGADVEVDWPHRRTDYVTAGAPLSLFGSAGFTEEGDGFGNETTVPVALRQGEEKHVRMFGAPFGPELTTPPTSRQDGEPVPYAYREGDELTLAVPMFADNDPADASSFHPTDRGSTVVYAGGREIGRRDDLAGLGTFDLPAGPGTFRVVADANRPASLLQEPALSTRTRAEWTFEAPAGTPERVALPFLDIRWDLPLDDHNRAPRGALLGGLTVATQPGARAAEVRSVTVEVSYDDGRTWRGAVVDHADGRFRVRLPDGGAPGGYASLRATATDDAGGAVTETVVRAYALR